MIWGIFLKASLIYFLDCQGKQSLRWMMVPERRRKQKLGESIIGVDIRKRWNKGNQAWEGH